jgi:hypothetical protein
MGTAPAYGYGYGAAAFNYPGVGDPMLPGREYTAAPFDPQMYGRDTHAELDGFQLGSFTDTIRSIVGGIANAATNVENIARGISTGAQATQYVTNRAVQGGGALFQPSPADLAAKQIDVTSLLGGQNLVPLVVIGGGLLLVMLMRNR